MEDFMDQAMNIIDFLVEGASRAARLQFSENTSRLDASESEGEFLLFQSLLKMFEERIQFRLRVKVQQHNANIPIHRLPDELLIRIFRFYSLGNNHYSALHTIALVSPVWANLVSNTSSLWAIVHSDHPRRIYQECLSKSGTSPLTVTFNDVRSDWSRMFILDAYALSVLTHAERWRALRFTVTSPMSLEALESLLKVPVPLLEDLEIKYSIGTGDRELDIFPSGASRLRHLSLTNIMVPPGSELLSGLVTLTISLSQIPGLSAQQILYVLRACPDLIQLELRFAYQDESLIPPDTHKVDLPKLINLDLKLRPDAMQHILSRVYAPSCTTFNIESIYSDTRSAKISLLSEATEHLTPNLTKAIQRSTTLAIEISPSSLTFATNDASIRLLLLGDKFAPQTFEWLLDRVHMYTSPAGPSVSLRVSGADLRFSTICIMALLSRSITHLSLRLDGGDTRGLVTHLSEPCETTFKWPLPNLQVLSLLECREVQLEDLLFMVESRAGRGRFQETHKLPVRLSKLFLPEAWGLDAAQKLKEVVDEVVSKEGIGCFQGDKYF
ncbi:hypothetical protein FRB93_002120 [Tulasnella sp. JGI-2019a]|nr:hypothetical protein FRB93_002120 [Tulasnella sp. JGI-2019a]